jgi:hypothetical protein
MEMGRPPEPSDRTLGMRLVYGFGVAILLSIPAWLIVMILRPFVGGWVYWVAWAVTAVGFFVGLLLGERGLNTVGRFLRSVLEWRP